MDHLGVLKLHVSLGLEGNSHGQSGTCICWVDVNSLLFALSVMFGSCACCFRYVASFICMSALF